MLDELDGGKFYMTWSQQNIYHSQLTFSHNFVTGYANHGNCASRNLKYFSFNLVACSTLNGVPMGMNWYPATWMNALP